MLTWKTKKRPYRAQLPLTALIDIVFLLLVYFLLTTNFIVVTMLSRRIWKKQVRT